VKPCNERVDVSIGIIYKQKTTYLGESKHDNCITARTYFAVMITVRQDFPNMV